MIGRSLQYFNESQCMRAIRSPGNVNNAPRIPQQTAVEIITISLLAGPLDCSFCFVRKAEALSLKL